MSSLASPDNEFVCLGCPDKKVFKSNALLKRHVVNHLVSDAQCQECGLKREWTLNSITEHFYACRGNCPLCGIEFGKASHLNNMTSMMKHRQVCQNKRAVYRLLTLLKIE